MSTCYDDGSGGSSTVTVPFPQGPTTLPTTPTPSASGTVPTWLQNIFTIGAKTGSQIAVQTTVPQGYYQLTTPYGQVMSTAGIPQGTTLSPQGLFSQQGAAGGIGGLMPILLIGGLVLVVMMGARR
jgi:hypothetical protein